MCSSDLNAADAAQFEIALLTFRRKQLDGAGIPKLGGVQVAAQDVATEESHHHFLVS